MTSEELIHAAMESDEAFIKELPRIIKEELHSTAADFSEKSGIPASTIYKLLSGQPRTQYKDTEANSNCYSENRRNERKMTSLR